jgi:hypothetical protein
MASLINAGNALGTGSVTLQVPNTNSVQTVNIPDSTGNMVVSTAVTASVLGTVTNKVAVNIGGTVYYLLASTSGV